MICIATALPQNPTAKLLKKVSKVLSVMSKV